MTHLPGSKFTLIWGIRPILHTQYKYIETLIWKLHRWIYLCVNMLWMAMYIVLNNAQRFYGPYFVLMNSTYWQADDYQSQSQQLPQPSTPFWSQSDMQAPSECSSFYKYKQKIRATDCNMPIHVYMSIQSTTEWYDDFSKLKR